MYNCGPTFVDKSMIKDLGLCLLSRSCTTINLETTWIFTRNGPQSMIIPTEHLKKIAEVGIVLIQDCGSCWSKILKEKSNNKDNRRSWVIIPQSFVIPF